MLKLSEVSRSERIRRINDACRRSFMGCFLVRTAAFADLPHDVIAIALHRVRSFKEFGNDPDDEHDLGFLDVCGERVFFRFDYYGDRDLKTGANDPSDTTRTWRTLTVGLASDY